MALKHPAAEKALVVHNDGNPLSIASDKWSVVIAEAQGGITLRVLHSDSSGAGMVFQIPNPRV